MPNNSEQTILLGTDVQGTPLLLQKPRGIHQLIFCAFGYDQASNRMLSLLGFNGEARAPSGYYLLGDGYRAYHSATMRFGSPDSVSPFGDGGVNNYAYCLGDPINWRDPSGRTRTKGILRSSPKKNDAIENRKTRLTFNETVEIQIIESTLSRYPGWEKYIGLTKEDKAQFKKLESREIKLRHRNKKLKSLHIASLSNKPKDNANYSNYTINKVNPLKEKIKNTVDRLNQLHDNQPVDIANDLRIES